MIVRPEPIAFTSRLVDAATQASRMAICATCEHNRGGNCSLCQTCGGRPVPHKVRWEHETCPKGKWPVVVNEGLTVHQSPVCEALI